MDVDQVNLVKSRGVKSKGMGRGKNEKATHLGSLAFDDQTERLTGFAEGHAGCAQRKMELQDIEQRRNDLLPYHQQMPKRCQKLQSLQDKKKQCQKDAGTCNGDMERITDEIAEKDVQLPELERKIQRIYWAEAELG